MRGLRPFDEEVPVTATAAPRARTSDAAREWTDTARLCICALGLTFSLSDPARAEAPLAADVLLPAIDNALARSRAVLAQEAEVRELRKRHDSLSGREREVMAGVVAGHLNKRVGATLGISRSR